MNTFLWKRLDDYFVVVHTTTPPSDNEWNEVLAEFRKFDDLKRARIFVYTEGGAPNARQRALLNQVMATAKPPVAVLTSSSLARAAGTAISWFNPAIRLFAPDDAESALDHLAAAGVDRVRLRKALHELKAKLGCR